MTERNPAHHTAVSWHSVIARDFDASYQKHVPFRERVHVWSDLIGTYAKPGSDGLDLGCGSGMFTLRLAGVCGAVTALDGSPEMVDLCREKMAQNGATNVSYVVSDIAAAEQAVGGKTFDIVTCCSVTEYLPDLDGAITVMSHLVKSGGTLIVSAPNRRSFFRKIEPYLHKYIGRPRYYRFVKNVLTLEDMTARMEKNGFEIIEHRFYARTRILSPLFRRIGGLRRYSDNMFVLVCRKK